MNKVASVDEFLDSAKQWQSELARLRKILLSCGLDETIKWGGPCYTFQSKNVVGLAGFKQYCGLWFHQGTLLEDTSNVLTNAQVGKTQAQRQWRFHHANDIKPRLIKRYVKEAMALVEAGKEIKPRGNKLLEMPLELKAEVAANQKFAKTFAALSPGRQREYAEFVADAKREATRASRLDKIRPMVLQGVGLNDKYRS